jgi:hypothetical protein
VPPHPTGTLRTISSSHPPPPPPPPPRSPPPPPDLVPLDTSAPRALAPTPPTPTLLPDIAIALPSPSTLSPPAPWPLPPRRALAFGVSRAGFSRWARYRCVRRAPGLIYEAFAGTSRPRIIIKIPRLTSSTLPLHPLHSPCSSASSRSAAAAAVAPVAARRALTFRDITFHSELDQSFNGRKFNLCAATK